MTVPVAAVAGVVETGVTVGGVRGERDGDVSNSPTLSVDVRIPFVAEDVSDGPAVWIRGIGDGRGKNGVFGGRVGLVTTSEDESLVVFRGDGGRTEGAGRLPDLAFASHSTHLIAEPGGAWTPLLRGNAFTRHATIPSWVSWVDGPTRPGGRRRRFGT